MRRRKGFLFGQWRPFQPHTRGGGPLAIVARRWESYAAFTVSQSQAGGVLAYMQRQEKHHRQFDFRAELKALLERHGIAFEDRYML